MWFNFDSIIKCYSAPTLDRVVMAMTKITKFGCNGLVMWFSYSSIVICSNELERALFGQMLDKALCVPRLAIQEIYRQNPLKMTGLAHARNFWTWLDLVM